MFMLLAFLQRSTRHHCIIPFIWLIASRLQALRIACSAFSETRKSSGL